MLRLLAAAALGFALASCANPSPTGMDLTSGAAKAIGPDGKPATIVMCGMIGHCFIRATAICGKRELTVLGTNQLGKDSASITFRCS